MADLDANWESLLRTELEGDDASVARTLDTVGRLLLECVCRIRPAGVDADEHVARRPYRRFRAHVPTSDDERAEDEENRVTFSPIAVPSGAPLTPPARLNAHETLAELTAAAATEERSGELVLRLLAADVRFLIHPVVALNIAEWHRVIRAGRHRELSTHAPLSEEAARDLVDGLAQILVGHPGGMCRIGRTSVTSSWLAGRPSGRSFTTSAGRRLSGAATGFGRRARAGGYR
jgi:hypothetical protein